MTYERKTFATLEDGTEIGLHILSNGVTTFSMMDWGASWVSAIIPSAAQGKADILLGFSDLQGFMGVWGCFGATIGRYANRIANARFAIGGVVHELDKTLGKHSLHGGRNGWHRKVWDASGGADADKAWVSFFLKSPSGESGYPGNLDARVSYSLDAQHRLQLDYEVSTDADTHLNLSNHAYFNLRGQGRGEVLDQELEIGASSYLETGRDNLPTGRMKGVAGGPLDFRTSAPLGPGLRKLKGYDHCFALERKEGDLFLAAVARDPQSGRRMRLLTSQPGLQLYTRPFKDWLRGKRGFWYRGWCSFCLETQHFPDSPNMPAFPPTLVKAGELYKQKTIYEFSW